MVKAVWQLGNGLIGDINMRGRQNRQKNGNTVVSLADWLIGGVKNQMDLLLAKMAKW